MHVLPNWNICNNSVDHPSNAKCLLFPHSLISQKRNISWNWQLFTRNILLYHALCFRYRLNRCHVQSTFMNSPDYERTTTSIAWQEIQIQELVEITSACHSRHNTFFGGKGIIHHPLYKCRYLFLKSWKLYGLFHCLFKGDLYEFFCKLQLI
jgi:hypothetical protein